VLRLDRVGEIEEAAGVYAETKIEETGGTETSVRSSGARSARKRMTRMKAIALIDTRLDVPGVSLGILVSTHPDVMAAFAANDAFQKAEASGRHI
jgi:hypothetical protein